MFAIEKYIKLFSLEYICALVQLSIILPCISHMEGHLWSSPGMEQSTLIHRLSKVNNSTFISIYSPQ